MKSISIFEAPTTENKWASGFVRLAYESAHCKSLCEHLTYILTQILMQYKLCIVHAIQCMEQRGSYIHYAFFLSFNVQSISEHNSPDCQQF